MTRTTYTVTHRNRPSREALVRGARYLLDMMDKARVEAEAKREQERKERAA